MVGKKTVRVMGFLFVAMHEVHEVRETQATVEVCRFFSGAAHLTPSEP